MDDSWAMEWSELHDDARLRVQTSLKKYERACHALTEEVRRHGFTTPERALLQLEYRRDMNQHARDVCDALVTLAVMGVSYVQFKVDD